MGSTVGLNIDTIFQRLLHLEAPITKEILLQFFNNEAQEIYHTTPITNGIQAFGKELTNHQYHIGVVSASPRQWMELVIERLNFKEAIEVVISLEERKDLPHKPSPAGYLEAIRELHAIPQTTIILEDSNTGIAAAKAAQAYTIGLRQNLIANYVQEGADIYANTIADVEKIVLQRNRH